MAVGADNTGTVTREALLRDRGYDEAVIHANGNGHHPEVDTPPPAPVEELPAPVVEEPAPSCALDGCTEPLPPGRRKYCTPEHSAEAERRRIKAKAQRETVERAAARAAQPKAAGAKARGPIAVAAVDRTPDLDEHQVDGHRRPSVGQLATEILAAGYSVEVTIDGATLVARGRR